MKKLFLISEEEKNRILNIHSNAVKRQYLSEQRSDYAMDQQANAIARSAGIRSQGDYEKVANVTKKAATLGTPASKPKVSQDELNKREARWKSDLICVTKQPGVKKIPLTDGTNAYKIGEVIYYNTGRKKVDGKMYSYNCNTEFVKKGTKSGGDIQKRRTEIINKTTENTKQIQKLLGVPETGQMDTGLLQLINTKLKGETQQPRQKLEPINLKSAGVVTNTAKPTADTNIPKPAQTK